LHGATAGGRASLGPLLAAIAAEVAARTSGAEAEIMAWYAAGVAHALRHSSPDALAGTLRALRAERAARLAAVKRNAAVETHARQQAAVRDQMKTGTHIRDDMDSDGRVSGSGRLPNRAAHRRTAARPSRLAT
jgi:hypothetical protein